MMKTIFQKLSRYFQNQWHLAVLDPRKGLWTVHPTPFNIPYLKAKNAHGCHILMQPLHPSSYLMADDLTQETISHHHRLQNGIWKPGRMVVETSPGNFQVWIHSRRPLSTKEKRFWLKKLLSDPAAHPENRWGRCPGFRNCKEKYRNPHGHFPLSKLIWIDWKHQANIPEIPLENIPCPPFTLSNPSPRWPVCRLKAISRARFQRGNDSQTDFAYTLALARRGFTDDQIRNRILSERTCWKNHQGEKRKNHYLDRTIARARKIVETT